MLMRFLINCPKTTSFVNWNSSKIPKLILTLTRQSFSIFLSSSSLPATMSSTSSSGVSDTFTFGRRGYRGIPRKCRCGEETVMRTSRTETNPGRLLHCCPYRTEHNKSHLFKWTDVAMVEEMEDVENVVEKTVLDVARLEKGLQLVESEMVTLACETRTCEAVVNSYGNEIEAMKAVREGLEKEILEIKDVAKRCENELESLRSFKNMVICGGLVMSVVYFFLLP